MKSKPSYFLSLKRAPRLTPSAGLETTILTGLAGEAMMMVRTVMQPGHCVRVHTHPEELLAMVCSGKAVLRIAEEERTVSPGDFCLIPANVPHSVSCIGDEPFVVVEVFSPARQDFIEKVRSGDFHDD